MIKIEDNFNSICCNTRLKYKCSKEKGKYTASDMEIFTDLSELRLVTINPTAKQQGDHEVICSLPQKRKKGVKIKPVGFVVYEDEVVSALASLMGHRKVNLGSNGKLNERIFDSNLKKLIKVISSVKHEEILHIKSKQSGIEKLNSIKTQKMLKNTARPAMRLF